MERAAEYGNYQQCSGDSQNKHVNFTQKSCYTVAASRQPFAVHVATVASFSAMFIRRNEKSSANQSIVSPVTFHIPFTVNWIIKHFLPQSNQ